MAGGNSNDGIQDRAIIARMILDAGSPFSREYLCREQALFADAEWRWSGDRAAAYVFGSHREADAAVSSHRYRDTRGHWHTPFALVLAEKELRERDCNAPAADVAAAETSAAPQKVSPPSGASVHRLHRRARHHRQDASGIHWPKRVTPQQAFAELERRHLA